jgi:predicted nucleic acid-binding protein
MDAVADAGPILSFARAHCLGLLQQVVGTLIVPCTVYEEIVVHGAGKPGSTEVQAASWIIRASVKDQAFDELITAGTYMSDTLYRAFLYDVGEA